MREVQGVYFSQRSKLELVFRASFLLLLLLFFKIDNKNSLWKPHFKFWNHTVSYSGGHCIYIGIMLNNKIALMWCHVLESTALVLYLKLFSYVTCLPCATENFSVRTLYRLCVDDFPLIILYQYQPMRIFSGDFLLIFVL